MATISGVSGDPVPPQLDSPKSEATRSSPSSGAETTGLSEATAATEISISSLASDAQAILAGAAAAENPDADPVVKGLEQSVADGNYHRPALGIAKAMLAFERHVVRRGTGE